MTTDIKDKSVAKETAPVSPWQAAMEALVASTGNAPAKGEVVAGPVIEKAKMAIYVDLGTMGTGIIFGREYLNARDLIKKVSIGDTVSAKVVDPENAEGYVELSLREAKQAAIWREAEAAIKEKRQVELTVKDANKGGIMLEWEGIMGFLPASQLKAEHYPRVQDGDKDRILSELKKLIGEKISVIIITADPKEGKLIFSEKSGDTNGKQELVAKYAVGDVVLGEVTGVVDFGIFMKVEEGLEGLVHISEIDWSLVENPKDRFKVGEKISAKVIDIKDGKISLSIKALKKNPWKEAEEKYKKGDSVEGVVIKFNKYGALVSVEEGVAGLCLNSWPSFAKVP
jgi:small subunit ribosomal protein S1